MDFMSVTDGVIEFAKDKIDRVLGFWNDLEDDRKKLLIGCVVAAVCVVSVAAVAYAIGKARGRDLAFEEEDF
jgi:hypothetical protein